MGYEVNEQPMVDATIYYHDNGHYSSVKFCETVLFAFKKYGYFDVTNIELGKHKFVNGILKDYVVRYSKKDVSKIDLQAEIFAWVNDDEITYISFIHKEQRHLIWNISWYKNYTMPDGVSISDYMFNYLVIESSYERLEITDIQDSYIELFCNLADVFEAFYGRIEDISTAISVMDRTKERCFSDEYLQSIYWGNYFGKKICEDLGQEKLERLPVAHKEFTEAGFFFTLTDDIKDSATFPDWRLRKKVYKQLAPSRKCRLSDFKCIDDQNEPET